MTHPSYDKDETPYSELLFTGALAVASSLSYLSNPSGMTVGVAAVALVSVAGFLWVHRRLARSFREAVQRAMAQVGDISAWGRLGLWAFAELKDSSLLALDASSSLITVRYARPWRIREKPAGRTVLLVKFVSRGKKLASVDLGQLFSPSLAKRPKPKAKLLKGSFEMLSPRSPASAVEGEGYQLIATFTLSLTGLFPIGWRKDGRTSQLNEALRNAIETVVAFGSRYEELRWVYEAGPPAKKSPPLFGRISRKRP